MGQRKYDVIVVGGGHNGLVAAAYLARNGKRTCVLERRERLGGCCSTEEPWPGFKISPAAYCLSLFPHWLIDDLHLEHHGLTLLRRNPSSFTPLPDGRSLLLGAEEAANRESIAQISPTDADRFPEYEAFLDRITQKLEPLLTGRMPELPPRWWDLSTLWRHFRAAQSLGPELRPALELLFGAVDPFLRQWFESDVLRATLATDGIIGAFAAPATPGTGYVFLHHLMGQVSDRKGEWVYVRGGMGGLADALARTCRQAGVEIHTETEVRAIECPSGRATGVTLADGAVLEADTIVSNLDAHRTLVGLVGEAHLSRETVADLSHIDYDSASAKVNLALDGLPDFKTGSIDPEVALRGTIHIAPSLPYIEQAFADAKQGKISKEPVMEITIPSTLDDTLAPNGKHVMSIFVQYAPYRLTEGEWDDAQRAHLANRCLDVLQNYAPDIKQRVLHRQVLAPPDLEAKYGLTGGNIFQGAMNLTQVGPFRAHSRTPVPGIWLCGAATHPGGGVMGINGYRAAQAVLKAR